MYFPCGSSLRLRIATGRHAPCRLYTETGPLARPVPAASIPGIARRTNYCVEIAEGKRGLPRPREAAAANIYFV